MDKLNPKIQLEGNLFVLVEENINAKDDEEDVNICAEIGGVNIWDWLKMHNGNNIKITMELLDGD